MPDEPEPNLPVVTFAIFTLTTLVEVGLWHAGSQAKGFVDRLEFMPAVLLGWFVMLVTALVAGFVGVVRWYRDRQAHARGEQTPVRQRGLVLTGFIVALVVNVGIVLIGMK